MNCPGHMLLFGSALRSYRDLPLRYAEAAPLHRNELAGALHGLTARPLRHAGRRAHLLHARSRSTPSSTARSTTSKYLYGLFGLEPRAELSTRPGQQARHRRGVGLHRGRARARARAARRSTYFVGEGEGSFYGPKIDLHMTDVLGRSWQLGTIQLDAQMPARFGLTYMGADNHEHPVFVIHRALLRLVRALHRHPHRALRRRVPVLARARAGAPDPGRRGPPRRGRASCASGSRPRATGSTSTSATRRSASGSATPSSRRSRTSSSTATASRTTRSPCGSAAAGSRRGRLRSSWSRSPASLLRSRPESRSGPRPSPPERQLIGGSTESS